jgi:hypothetical protein
MEIPVCPIAEHADSRVVRDGWYGKPPHPHDDPKGTYSLISSPRSHVSIRIE